MSLTTGIYNHCHKCFKPLTMGTYCSDCYPNGFPSPMDVVDSYYGNKVLKPKDKIKSDGGPSSYYDFPKGAITLNDLIEHKSDTQWLGDSFHLSNITKAAWRWGDKEGTTKEYDARKFIYSGCRLLMKYAGVSAVRKTLQDLLDDPQFQERDKT